MAERGSGTGPSNGRRMRELKLINDKNAKEVTFSKRRCGLFRKASELSILCGAEVAIITYSPHGNPFVFGSPSVPSVLGRFAGLAHTGEDSSTMSSQDRLSGFVREDREALSRLAESRKRLGAGSGEQSRRWWEDPMEDLKVEELEGYVERLKRLREVVGRRVKEMERSAVGATTAPAPSNAGMVDPMDNLVFENTAKEEPTVFGGYGLELMSSPLALQHDYDLGFMPLWSDV